ncbi:MAG TPA: DUF1553 domain-containing protein [Caulifigura sp.]|nr:DUF1553 domain-containing protein [Caulifigura sp.]
MRKVLLTTPMLQLFLFSICVIAQSVEAPPRVTDGLVASYSLDSAPDGVIRDQQSQSDRINLRIDKPQSVLLRSGGSQIVSSVLIASDGPARRLTSAIKTKNELSIEVWLKPRKLDLTGPARIVSLSQNPSLRNFTLGQDKGQLEFRIRTTSTDDNGLPALKTPESSLVLERTHVVVTRSSDGTLTIYLNGQPSVSKQVAGTFQNWDEEYRLSLANELTSDRPWLGDLFLVALYNRALSVAEVQQNFHAGLPAAINYASLLPPVANRKIDFVRDVQPILREHCYDCHSADHEDGALNLGIRQRAMLGGLNGAVIAKGDSANSRLIHLTAAIDKKQVMPPDSEGLSANEVGILRAWIDQGAVWPDGLDIPDPRVEQAKTHWAFQPLKSTEIPAVKNEQWPRTPIDRFVLSKLEQAGLSPAERADARHLVRRMTFDLTGLPPTPEEVDQFCAAASKNFDDATLALIDRLLASTHHGERWARHWLDVARYADSDGQESDRDRPSAYRYRDFVIRALNDNMPFDQFIRWQLAGDEYAPANTEALAATGFLVAGPFAALPDRLMEDERLRNRYNELDDVISTIGTGLLGLTLGCTRCHDHKYDAIPARDYYSLMSAFHGGERAEVEIGPAKDKYYVFKEQGRDPAPTWLFQRANYYDRDQPVSLGFVSLMTNGKSPDEYWQEAKYASADSSNSTSQRRALADWITDPEHGAGTLLARVIVNRVWMHHFGQGLVRTPGDFGVRAEPPTHPELLEWLTQDFIQQGWRLKHLHRMILSSSVYQQSSRARSQAADSDNRLLSRMPLMRLEGEVLRDSMLAVSGALNPAEFGPAVRPPIASEAIVARNLKSEYPKDIKDGPEVRRRSIYLFHKRVVPYPLLQAFDKPDAQQSCSRRDRTTVAPQALTLLNDPFVRTMSNEFANRISTSASSTGESVNQAYRLALGRSATSEELAAGEAFIAKQISERRGRDAKVGDDVVRREAGADFCQVLFGLNEFLYVD